MADEKLNTGPEEHPQPRSKRYVYHKPAGLWLLERPDGHFIVDLEAAPVVKQIFSLCLAGNGPTKIARMLTARRSLPDGSPDRRGGSAGPDRTLLQRPGTGRRTGNGPLRSPH